MNFPTWNEVEEDLKPEKAMKWLDMFIFLKEEEYLLWGHGSLPGEFYVNSDVY